MDTPQFMFNHDGFGAIGELAHTNMTEADAVDLLVRPLAESQITILDFAILTTAEHNIRTRHGFGFDGVGHRREIDRNVGKVVAHYNSQSCDLLDICVHHGQAMGLKVFGCVRLNHALHTDRVADAPGRPGKPGRKDFRDEAFHEYLAELFEDLLAKGVDGITLDFERKAPFFPDDASHQERFAACTAFVERIRRLTDKPICARVSHQREKGEPQGQDTEAWLAAGLIDIIVPATHNHEPDALDWPIDRFVAAAATSPRPCLVLPQIWPTADPWGGGKEFHTAHPPQAVSRRARQLVADGADGAYFFNFCCYHVPGRLLPNDHPFNDLA